MNGYDEEYIEKVFFFAQSAIEDSDLDKLDEEFKKCPEVINYYTKDDRTLLHTAAWEATPEFIEYLVEKGIDVDRVVDEKSALSLAVIKNKTDNVHKLIELGAKMDSTMSFNNPLFFAIQSGNIEIAKILIEAGIDLTPVYKTKDNPWWDTLSYARYYKQTEIVKLIEEKLEHGITVEDKATDHEDDEEDGEYIDDYIESYLGTISESFEDIIPASKVSVTVNIIMPNKERDYITLVTTGMCNEPMAETDMGLKYAELIMKLPSNWKTGIEMLTNPKYSWPLRILRKVAHLPHLHEGCYIDESVIIPNGTPGGKPLPFASGTKLSSVMLCKSEDIPPYQVDNETVVEFFTLVPIAFEEEDFVKKNGSRNVMESLESKDLVNLKRKLLV